MRRASMKIILGATVFGALFAGCATTVEMGPGYYHYDSKLVRAAPAVVDVYPEPAVVYHEPVVVYHDGVIYNDR